MSFVLLLKILKRQIFNSKAKAPHLRRFYITILVYPWQYVPISNQTLLPFLQDKQKMQFADDYRLTVLQLHINHELH